MEKAPSQGRVTQQQIAVACGVSTKTVSDALRGKPSVSSNTAEKIRQKAEELGYGRTLPRIEKARRNVIGLTIPYIDHIAYSELSHNIITFAKTSGYRVIIGETGGVADIEENLFEEFTRYDLRGIIMISPRLEDLNAKSQLIPIVTLFVPTKNPEELRFGSIEIDNELGGKIATEHLVSLGRKNIVYLAGRRLSASNANRQAGYRSVMEANNLNFIIQEQNDDSFSARLQGDAGFNQCMAALETNPEADGFFVYNDAMAMGALRALQLKGRFVPKDVSLVGFDNLSITKSMYPSLTTVGCQLNAVASSAVGLLKEIINKNGRIDGIEFYKKLPPELIRRESSQQPELSN